METPVVVRLLSGLFIAVVAAAALAWGLLVANGGHLYMVETPSMARTAPVGTLVVAEKVDPSTLSRGDIITFRPPSNPRLYTHRIVEVTPAGFRTKGDLNAAPDGWVVPRANVVGKAVHLWFGLGWLLKMIPWLALGGFLTALVRWRTAPRLKQAVLIAGASLSVSLALIIVRPLVRAETIGFVPVGTKAVKISAVGTGLLPIRATSLDNRHVDLVAGQLGWVTTAKADEHGRYQLLPTLHLSWWGWVLMGLVCALPLLASLIVRSDDEDGEGGSGSSGLRAGLTAFGAALARRRRHGTRAAAALSSIAVVLALGTALSPTAAALTATVTNSTDTTRTRAFFTCLDAMKAYLSPVNGFQLYMGHRVGNDSTASGTTDVQSTPGSYTMSFTNITVVTPTTKSDTGCQSDFGSRSQGYVHLDGTSKIDFGAMSGISSITADPGNDNRMAWQEWFRTTTKTGGIIQCNSQYTNGCAADRSTYMDNNGRLNFNVGSTTLTSASSYNDGQWHMVTAAIDDKKGSTLWVDGAVVASSATATAGNAGVLYPQYGYSTGTLGYTNAPSTVYFTGDLQMTAIYGWSTGNGITTAQVKAMYEAGLP